jgi:HPt (histidine-containing phosphotransfer) domain-containing protein
MNDEPILDDAEALSRVADDEVLLKELFDELFAMLPECLEQIDSAAENGDADTVRRAAHSLKGSAANLSAKALAGLAFRIEELGREKRLSNLPPLRARFEDAVRDLREAVEKRFPR